MILIYLRFYEELNDFLPAEKRKTQFGHTVKSRSSVKDVIESLGVPHSEIDLIMVNGIAADFGYIVQQDDKISVYPVFESFDISGVTHLRAKPLRNPKFIADVHLGKLAGYLRMLGIDTLYKNEYSKEEIIQISVREKRVILSRDRNLLKRNVLTHAYWVRSEDPAHQAHEVLERFHLEKEIKEFSLCMKCNFPLEKIARAEVIEKIPPKVKEYHNNFFICRKCERIYWRGTHYKKMKKLISSITAQRDS